MAVYSVDENLTLVLLSAMCTCFMSHLLANSAFHPSGVSKWVPASVGKAKVGYGSFR